MGEVDGRGLGSVLGMQALGLAVSFPESLEGRDGLCDVEESLFWVQQEQAVMHTLSETQCRVQAGKVLRKR